jgi:16S rRNA (cytidine1402-2'-O)-methyltransferase
MSCPETLKTGLVLIPTPIEESLPLEPVALEVLKDAAATPSTLILVEELKAGRIRWLRWGLPRETIDRFIAYNEHTESELFSKISSELRGKNRAVLLSDGGLPAFCDPGQRLVDACHTAGIKVTSTPFPNSIALAIALSGFDHRTFHFAGFPPAQSEERKRALDQLHTSQKSTLILMDTPYRLKALLQAISESSFKSRRIFLATGLNSSNEQLFRGKPVEILSQLKDLEKAEFVIVIEGAASR